MLNIATSTAQRIRRLSGEGLWVVLGQAAAVIGSLAGVRLLTELLDPVSYGQLALGMTVATLVNQVLLGPLGNGAARFYGPAIERSDLAGYLTGVWMLLTQSASLIFIFLGSAMAGLWIAGRGDLFGMTLAAGAFALLSGCNAILNGMQNAARQRSVVALHQGVEPWARFVVAAALLLVMGGGSAAAMWGYTIASLLVLVSQTVFFLKTTPRSLSTRGGHDWQRQIKHYSLPFGTWGVFTWLQMASDRWALERFAATEEVGLFVVLYQLGYYPIATATGMAVQFLAPILYGRAGDARDARRNESVHRLAWRLTGLALLLTGIATSLAFALQREIFGVLVSAQYASVAQLLPLVVLSGGFFAAAQTLALRLMSLMETESMVLAKIATALLGTILNVAGARWYGITGVVLAGVAFSLCYLGWMVILCWRYDPCSKTKNKRS